MQAASAVLYARPDEPRGWRAALNWTAAILISLVFLVAGIWKLSDPSGAAVRLAQARVPEALSVAAALGFGIAETVGGLLLLVPRFRRWGALVTSLLLVAFMIFIGIHYNELRGAECSCFPWVKRAVGPGFFIGDGIMLLLAIAAGVWARKPAGLRPALAVLAAVTVLAGASYGVNLTRHTGTRAPASVKAEDGSAISLREGKVFVYFFNPQCLHCLEAGRKLAALNWGDTRFVGVPTENARFAGWFMGKAGLTGKGPVAPDPEVLKKVFPFDLPPAGVAIENGYEKGMLLQFEGDEPGATLKKLGFAH
ncbi:MAG: DoxX family protein [Acidobacteriota bacterium]